MKFLCDEWCVFELCALWIMCGVRALRGVCLCEVCALQRMFVVSGVCLFEVCALWNLCVINGVCVRCVHCGVCVY